MTIQQEIQALEVQLAVTTGAEAQAAVMLDILTRHVRLRTLDEQEYTGRLQQLATELDSDRYRAWVLYYRAVAARFAGDYPVSMTLSMQALPLFVQAQDQIGVGNCYNNTGNIHENQGNYAAALRDHLQALAIREQSGDRNGLANSYINTGVIYYWQENFDDALKYNYMAVEIMKELDNKQGLASAYINIGNVYLELKKYQEALDTYTLCQEINRESGNPYGVAMAEANIGNIYREQGQYAEALEHYHIALPVFGDAGSRYLYTMLITSMGLVYLEQEEDAQAITALLQAMELCEEMGIKEEAMRASGGLTTLYRRLGDYEQALKYYEKYHQLDKETRGQEAQKQLMQLNFRHEIDLQEKEAQLLKEKNEAINVYAQKLEVSNNELKQFAHVASHDLREPLRMVTAYMNLLEKNMGDQLNPLQKQFIDFAVDGAKRMEQLILDLLRLAKVDANPRIEHVPLSTIVNEVKSNLEILLQEKNAQILAGELPTLLADRTQVMQVFQNIIGNGIKYNESDSPAITIACTARATDLLLTIADNGIGIPADYREKAFQIFKRLPTEKVYQGSGIGLAICKKIVEGLGGSIAIGDNPGGGTVFSISLPMRVMVTGA